MKIEKEAVTSTISMENVIRILQSANRSDPASNTLSLFVVLEIVAYFEDYDEDDLAEFRRVAKKVASPDGHDFIGKLKHILEQQGFLHTLMTKPAEGRA